MIIRAREIPHNYRNKHLRSSSTTTSISGDILSNLDPTMYGIKKEVIARMLLDLNKRLYKVEKELFSGNQSHHIWDDNDGGKLLFNIVKGQNIGAESFWFYTYG